MQYICKFVIFLICISIINYCCFVFLLKNKKNLLFLYDHRNHLDLIHFQSLYPSIVSEISEKESSIKKQQAIGICVNFNFDPDNKGNTLGSILPFYTTINQYVVILTPSPFHKLSRENVNILYQFNVTSISVDNQTSNNNHLNRTSTVYHIECSDGRSGQSQHKCLLLCTKFYAQLKIQYISLRGILYIADDLYFNFDYVYSHPERFSLDEIWTTPWMQSVNIITNDKGYLGNTWWWWKNKPHLWTSFTNFFLSPSTKLEEYQRIFQILYGLNKRLAAGTADLLYLPFTDNQLTSFISITNEFMKIFPSDMFCEIIFPLLVDTTMSICGHWPFENDREIYNSSVNRLNNLSIMYEMERTYSIKSARDPYSLNRNFRQRPCLFNPDGFIWGDLHRQNKQLFERAIINRTIPMTHLLKPWSYKTEFIHPMKLSNRNHWSFQLWHQGMQQQIIQLNKYQKDKTKVS